MRTDYTKRTKYIMCKQALIFLGIDTIDLELIVKMLGEYLVSSKSTLDRETFYQLHGIVENLEAIKNFICKMEVEYGV